MAHATRHPQHGSQADLEAGDREPFEVLLHLTAGELEQIKDALRRQSEMLAERRDLWPELRKQTKLDLRTVAGIVDAFDELDEQDAREDRARSHAWPASYQGRR